MSPPDDPRRHELGEGEVRALIARQLVIESARAAGLLVATPVGSAPDNVLLIAAGSASSGGLVPARVVRFLVAGAGDSDAQPARGAAEGQCLAIVDWPQAEVDGEDSVYLCRGTDLDGHAEWREARYLASPERWRTLFPDVSYRGYS